MIALQQLPAFAGLAASEMVVGVTPSARHDRLLYSYMFNIERGPAAVHDMMVADLRRFLDLGARREAADRLIVLRRFLSEHPQAGKVAPERKREAFRRSRFLRAAAAEARIESEGEKPAPTF